MTFEEWATENEGKIASVLRHNDRELLMITLGLAFTAGESEGCEAAYAKVAEVMGGGGASGTH